MEVEVPVSIPLGVLCHPHAVLLLRFPIHFCDLGPEAGRIKADEQ
jgi:hypothetical protein